MGRSYNEVFTLTGTAGGAGPEFHSWTLFTKNTKGDLRHVVLRRPSGDTRLVDVTPFWVTDEDDLVNAPPDDVTVTKATVIAMSASDTVASLDTDLDKPRQFGRGLRFGGSFNFTGAGDFTIVVTVAGLLDD